MDEIETLRIFTRIVKNIQNKFPFLLKMFKVIAYFINKVNQ